MRLITLLSACFLTGCATLPVPLTPTAPFTFIVLGDTAYNPPNDRPNYLMLIRSINDRRPSFTIHIGDTKGAGTCDDEFQQGVRSDFDTFVGPLIYTPGDNEWTDCYKTVNGAADPLERLAAIRRIFFANHESLGLRPIPLDVQTGSNSLPENRRWEYGSVIFATLHVVGSRNGSDNADEFSVRNRANLAWVGDTFATGKARQATALVLAFQADMFSAVGSETDDGFSDIREMIRRESLASGIPVLLVHGDGHRFVVDRPYYEGASDGSVYRGASVYRLQTFGAPELAAVEVRVEPGNASPFSFSPIFGPQSNRLR